MVFEKPESKKIGHLGMELRKECMITGCILLILEIVRLPLTGMSLYQFGRIAYDYPEFVDNHLWIIFGCKLISAVAQTLGLLFLVIIIVHIAKNNLKQNTVKAVLEPIGITYVIDTIVFIFVILYFKYRIESAKQIGLFIFEIAFKLLTPFFICIAWKYVTDTQNDDQLPTVSYPEEKPQDLLINSVPTESGSSGGNENMTNYYLEVDSLKVKNELPDSYYPRIYKTNSKDPNTVYTLVI